MADLSPNEYKALQALLTHPSKTEAAEAAGVSLRTLQRYLADEQFQAAYREAFQELVTDATRQVQQSLSPAIRALRSIVEDDGENASARISAARALLEYGLRMTELSDILGEMQSFGVE